MSKPKASVELILEIKEYIRNYNKDTAVCPIGRCQANTSSNRPKRSVVRCYGHEIVPAEFLEKATNNEKKPLTDKTNTYYENNNESFSVSQMKADLKKKNVSFADYLINE